MSSSYFESGSREAERYILRFPDGMRDRLKAIARTNGRSLNAEIVNRLIHSFHEHPIEMSVNRTVESPNAELVTMLRFAVMFFDQLTPSDAERMRKVLEKSGGAV